MKERYAEVQQLGGSVLVVSFAPPPLVAVYLEESPLPFPVVSDPERTAYRVFGLGRTTWSAMLRLRVLSRYLGLILGGWLPWRQRQEDVLQLGGDFVLDSHRRLVYAHRSEEPTDRPPVNELLRAVAAAVTGKEAAP